MVCKIWQSAPTEWFPIRSILVRKHILHQNISRYSDSAEIKALCHKAPGEGLNQTKEPVFVGQFYRLPSARISM